MTQETTLKLTVHSDGYQYEVELDDELSLTYSDCNQITKIDFGTLEEMEAVANAMLKAVKFHREA